MEWEKIFANLALTATKYHTLGALTNRHLFLTVLEAGKPKIWVPRAAFLLYLLMAKTEGVCVSLILLKL